MKKSHLIFCIGLIALLAISPMEAMPVPSIETRASTQYKKFIEALRCFKKKSWKHCTSGQKARVVAVGLALISIIGATVIVIRWKRSRMWKTPPELEKLQKQQAEERARLEAQRQEDERQAKREPNVQRRAAREWEAEEPARIDAEFREKQEAESRRNREREQEEAQEREEAAEQGRARKEALGRERTELLERQSEESGALITLKNNLLNEVVSIPAGQMGDAKKEEWKRRIEELKMKLEELKRRHGEEKRRLEEKYALPSGSQY